TLEGSASEENQKVRKEQEALEKKAYEEAQEAVSKYTKIAENITNYVTRDILNAPTPASRADKIEYWMKVLKHCELQHDHQSHFAITLAIKNCIADQWITREHLSQKTINFSKVRLPSYPELIDR